MSLIRLFVLFSLLGLASCTSSPQAPSNNPLPMDVPAVEPSVISLPILLDLEQLRVEALKQIPSPVVSGSETRVLRVQLGQPSRAPEPGSCSITQLNCLQKKATQALQIDYTAPVETKISYQAFVRDMALSMTGNTFTVASQIEFSINTRMESVASQLGVASCGINEPMPRIEFTLSGSVAWGPLGDVVITAKPYGIKWLRPCNITVFKLDLESLLNLPGIREKVQAAIYDGVFSGLRQASLRTVLAKAWPDLNAPRALQDKLWLLPHPQSVSFVEPQGNGRYVTTGVLVRALPEIVSGARPKVVAPPVPTPERGVSGEGIHLAVRGTIALTDAEELLMQQFAKPLQVGGKTVKVDQIRLYGHLDKAVVGLTLSQPIQAEIFLLGQPVFDSEKNEVRIEKLEYALGTKDFLVKAANWLLGSSFRSSLQQKARFRFDEDMADMLKDFRDYRQDLGNGLVLKGGVTRVRPQGLYFTQDQLIAHVLIDGRMMLEMRAGR